MSERQPNLLDVCADKLGVYKGTRVIFDLAIWSLAMHRAGDDWPALDQKGAQWARVRLFAEAGAYSERTAWRHLAEFRKCFPDEADPTRLVQVLEVEVQTRREAKALGNSKALWGLIVP
jgi:hypothetical protein